jgi:hypothetical protein
MRRYEFLADRNPDTSLLSTVGITNEPFAWAISADNKSIVGADTDGYFQMTVTSPDRIEM